MNKVGTGLRGRCLPMLMLVFMIPALGLHRGCRQPALSAASDFA